MKHLSIKEEVAAALNTKHHYPITTALFILIIICLIVDLAWTIPHPRPTRFLWFIVLLYFAVKLFRERDSEQCIWRQEYNRQQEQAEEAGISYEENRRIVKNPKIYLLEIPLILVIISVLLYLPNAFWPYRANWEYKGEIAWYKNINERLTQEYGESYMNGKDPGKKYQIFPDTIPKEAKCVKWYVLPGAQGSGSGYIYLSMKMPMEYIQDTIKHYASTAEILYYTVDDEDPEFAYGWWNDEETIGFEYFPGIDYEDKQAENVLIYLLSDDCGMETGYGFWVNEQENIICFFARGGS